MPPSADKYSNPHINTQAGKMETHKRILFLFPSAEVVNHKSSYNTEC